MKSNTLNNAQTIVTRLPVLSLCSQHNSRQKRTICLSWDRWEESQLGEGSTSSTFPSQEDPQEDPTASSECGKVISVPKWPCNRSTPWTSARPAFAEEQVLQEQFYSNSSLLLSGQSFSADLRINEVLYWNLGVETVYWTRGG